MDGLLIVDKPRGPTSHDIVGEVRRILGLRRVGHGGTLDPEATGVLLVAAGQATRFFPYLPIRDKTYEGVIRLGYPTDTYDASGRPTAEEVLALPSFEEIAAAMRHLEGAILQTPPPYSAKKLGGQPVYKLARARKEFILKPCSVAVRAFTLLAWDPPLAAFRTACSSGTYIRSLAHDVGRALGCGGHLHALRRTSVGPYTLAQAVSLEALREAAEKGLPRSHIIPVDALLPDVPAITLRDEAVARTRNGSQILPVHIAGPPWEDLQRSAAPLFRILGPSGELLALGRPASDREAVLPFLVIR